MKGLMKRLLLVAGLSVCSAALSPAAAKQGDMSVEVTGDVATAPAQSMGSAAGFTAGFGYEVLNELQLRGDVSYYHWNENGFSLDRIPLAVGLRKYYQLPVRELKLFGLAGLEISLDSKDAALLPGLKHDDTSFGAVLGGGVEYRFLPRFSVGGDVRFHLIKDWYSTVGFGVGYHF